MTLRWHLAVFWCRLTLRHRGTIGVTAPGQPFWMCNRCGEVVR